jgi:alkylated DNA nucleotide flippase Atl1
MPTHRKSWQEKLRDNKGFPRVSPITRSMRKSWGEGTFVIAAPMEVDRIMRRVPRGRVITIDEIRNRLARKHGATIACPITTGIFAWIAAHAAEEAAAQGKKSVTPWWRTLKSTGEINPKYPGGVAGQRRRLAKEGHRIVRRGKRILVEGFEEKIWKAGR